MGSGAKLIASLVFQKLKCLPFWQKRNAISLFLEEGFPFLRGYKIIGISPLTKIRPMLIYC